MLRACVGHEGPHPVHSLFRPCARSSVKFVPATIRDYVRPIDVSILLVPIRGALLRGRDVDMGAVSMRGMSFLAAAGVLVLAARAVSAQGLLPATEPGAALRPATSRSPAGVPAPEATTPTRAGATADAGWSAQEIELAKARCAVLLKGLAVVAVPEGPVREGNECGAPAPLRLISVGKEPQVAFSPPPTLICDMIAQLHKWVERDVQPLARKFLAAPVVRIEAMSSYSCRNAYGRAHGRLSEHGRANALDIGSFVTAHGQAALVISDWGPTAREVAAAAAAKREAPPQPGALAVRQAKEAPAATPQPVASVAPAEPPGRATAAAITGFSLSIPGIMVQIGGGSDKS